MYWEDGTVKRTIYTGRMDCTYLENDTDKGLYLLGGRPYVLGGWHCQKDCIYWEEGLYVLEE